MKKIDVCLIYIYMITKLKYLKHLYFRKFTGNYIQYYLKPVATTGITQTPKYIISATNGMNSYADTVSKINIRILNGLESTVASLPVFAKAPIKPLRDFKCLLISRNDFFEYYPINNTSLKVVAIPSNASNIRYAPIVGTDGMLYNVSRTGGTLNAGGTFFKMNPNTYEITILKNFLTDNNGQQPMGPPVEYTPGRFFGTASIGGANGGAGVIWEFNTNTNTYTKKYDLQTFWIVNDGMLLASNGKMYFTAMTGANSSTLCEYDPVGNTVTELKAFAGTTNPTEGNNVKSLPIELNGKLYGVSAFGGTNNRGVIWEYNYNTSTFTSLYQRASADGYGDQTRMMAASNGKIYGVSTSGGANNAGTIYEFNPTGNILTVVYNVPGGQSYTTTLTEIGPLVLYGGKAGTIFTYNINTSTFTIVHSPATIANLNDAACHAVIPY
jgi:uncharacterized repeat protein (TIGR03803 family)